nr:hypothetical protein [Tanacetum cinerariifolium]
MMLLARAITQKFFTPTNNRLRTSSNIRNQAMIQDGRVDIQTKNACYGGNGNKNAKRQSMNQPFNAGNAMKDKAGSNLRNEENDFMLDTSYEEETMEELTATAISEVNASSKVHEQVSHVKRKTIIQTLDDDQIDSNIIFDDPYAENNGGTFDHDLNDHDEYHKIQMLAYDVQREEKMACDVSWKSKLSTINDENVLLKTQVDYVVKERENIKLEYQKLFYSIKATRTQHKKELDELIEHVNQNTYAYADVRAQNQELLITISELKNKLKTIDKGKNVNTKFDKSETS